MKQHLLHCSTCQADKVHIHFHEQDSTSGQKRIHQFRRVNEKSQLEQTFNMYNLHVGSPNKLMCQVIFTFTQLIKHTCGL